mmetsp:Transcript_14109/g.36212  ORF Transcript_14109/g.36212 Transcript_14109/m.36212 type:complete len:294 (-) Transcript_14109:288-1169(-)
MAARIPQHGVRQQVERQLRLARGGGAHCGGRRTAARGAGALGEVAHHALVGPEEAAGVAERARAAGPPAHHGRLLLGLPAVGARRRHAAALAAPALALAAARGARKLPLVAVHLLRHLLPHVVADLLVERALFPLFPEAVEPEEAVRLVGPRRRGHGQGRGGGRWYLANRLLQRQPVVAGQCGDGGPHEAAVLVVQQRQHRVQLLWLDVVVYVGLALVGECQLRRVRGVHGVPVRRREHRPAVRVRREHLHLLLHLRLRADGGLGRSYGLHHRALPGVAHRDSSHSASTVATR